MAVCAVLFGREAISLSLVAMAALIILIIRPASLLSANFQMSFIAVTAFVAFYEVASPQIRRLMRPPVRLQQCILLYFLTLIATTVVAGIANRIDCLLSLCTHYPLRPYRQFYCRSGHRIMDNANGCAGYYFNPIRFGILAISWRLVSVL